MSLWLIVIIFIGLAIMAAAVLFVPELLYLCIAISIILLGYQGITTLLTLIGEQRQNVTYVLKGVDAENDLQVQVALPLRWSGKGRKTIELENLAAPSSLVSETMSIRLQGMGINVPTTTLELPLKSNSVVAQTIYYRSGWFPGSTVYLQARMEMPTYTIVTKIPMRAYGVLHWAVAIMKILPLASIILIIAALFLGSN